MHRQAVSAAIDEARKGAKRGARIAEKRQIAWERNRLGAGERKATTPGGRPRGGRERRLLLLSQASGAFPDAGGDAGPAQPAQAASRPATEGLGASKSKFFGHGTAAICHLTSPGGRTYYFLEFCDRAPVFLVRGQAPPAGRHRFPVRRDFLSPKRMPRGIRP
ncbi:hypothetical protein LMG26411_01329 [Cupriavidus numazuensis]|uniref:Uncharacterized protein n=1 Tax=Cupriavidus numazuensis TaxID=221992 RepID=A0ABM8TCY6_9BURK|nr:hypothetical protein LMG26411_01329 [Cupriavidus numazuensis]